MRIALPCALVALLLAALPAPALSGGPSRGGSPGAARPDATERRRPGARAQQLRKARQEVMKANALERGAETSGALVRDLHRAEALRSRARARLHLLRGNKVEARYAREASKHHARKAGELQRSPDPGTDALFRELRREAADESAYWRSRGFSGGAGRATGPKKATSRRMPSPTLRATEGAGQLTGLSRRVRAGELPAIADRTRPSQNRTMIRDRRLSWYSTGFGPAFDRVLGELKRTDTWVDVGAGRGVALAEYAERSPGGAQLVAVDLASDAGANAARFPGRFRLVEGDVTRVRVADRARLVTDVFGAMSYSPAPDRVIQRYGDLVAPGGHVMLFIGAQGRNRVLTADGRTRGDMLDYLRAVKGFEVEDVRAFDEGRAVLLRRTGGPARAPRLELLRETPQTGSLPSRLYRTLD